MLLNYVIARSVVQSSDESPRETEWVSENTYWHSNGYVYHRTMSGDEIRCRQASTRREAELVDSIMNGDSDSEELGWAVQGIARAQRK